MNDDAAREAAAASVAGAKASAADQKRPLYRQLPPAPPFPMDALGPLQPAAVAIQERTQAPPAMCAQSVLAAGTLAVQAHRDVDLPGAGPRPLTASLVSIAESGERKTTIDGHATKPVRRYEQRLREHYQTELEDFRDAHETWKTGREAAKKEYKNNLKALREALKQIGPEPKQPPYPMVLAEDLTPEALVLHLRDSRPWCGVFTSEGGTLIGGPSFSAEKAMQTAALLNTLWDGNAIRRMRVVTGNAFLPGRRCSAHIMMQPVVADRLLGDPVLDGIGTLSRMLIVAPETTMGTRMFREPPESSDASLNIFYRRIEALLERPPRMAIDTTDVLDPLLLTLAPDARELCIQFYNAVERDLVPGGTLHLIRPFGAKMAEHAGRLAAVLSTYADPDTMEVSGEAMECGILLAQHYAAEMLRLAGSAAIANDLRMAARLLGWWQARPDPRCYLVVIYQQGPYAIRDAETAHRIVAILEDHGQIRKLPAGTVLDGSPRREAWELVP